MLQIQFVCEPLIGGRVSALLEKRRA